MSILSDHVFDGDVARTENNRVCSLFVLVFMLCSDLYNIVVCTPRHCRFPLLLPILEPEYATNKIMQAIRSNQNVLMMPRLLYFTYFLLG